MLSEILIPTSLKEGDTIRVIAPSRSLSIIDKRIIELAEKRFNELGLIISYGKNVYHIDENSSSSISDRLEDLHDAFSDKKIKGVFTAIGGYNSNQLLDGIDYNLIQNNPKILCGFSDITVLLNAIFSQSMLITFLGPHFSSFGMEQGINFTIQSMKSILFNISDYSLKSSEYWSDDYWFKNQLNRHIKNNIGFEVLCEGKGIGRIIGGNIGSFDLLKGTTYFPTTEKVILIVEVARRDSLYYLERKLISYRHLLGEKLKGILIGRFRARCGISTHELQKMLKKHFLNLPIISNIDIGHTQPIGIAPVGSLCEINTQIEQKIIFHLK